MDMRHGYGKLIKYSTWTHGRRPRIQDGDWIEDKFVEVEQIRQRYNTSMPIVAHRTSTSTARHRHHRHRPYRHPPPSYRYIP
jgi:hypothetical protein